MLLSHLLNHLMQLGTLRMIDANGKTHVFSGAPGPTVTVRLHNAKVARDLFFNPRLKLGEAFMDGSLTIEDGSIYDFLDLVSQNMEAAPPHFLRPLYQGFGKAFRTFQQYNPMSRSRENVAHHYDLSCTLYDLFLDEDRQYSCAYYPTDDIPLDTAQANKKRHLAAKLLLKPGQRVLDIGCGWGWLALYLAKECGVHVTGLTLST